MWTPIQQALGMYCRCGAARFAISSLLREHRLRCPVERYRLLRRARLLDPHPLLAPNEPALPPEPIPMILTCPACGERHIDRGLFADKPHHTHACQACGMPWRPAIVATVGVQFLPGFRDSEVP